MGCTRHITMPAPRQRECQMLFLTPNQQCTEDMPDNAIKIAWKELKQFTRLWLPVLRVQHLRNQRHSLLKRFCTRHCEHQTTHPATVSDRNVGHRVYSAGNHRVTVARRQQTQTCRQTHDKYLVLTLAHIISTTARCELLLQTSWDNVRVRSHWSWFLQTEKSGPEVLKLDTGSEKVLIFDRTGAEKSIRLVRRLRCSS